MSTGAVLIVKFGAIGDVVMALSAVRLLADGGARVDWLCGPGVSPLLALYPWINPMVADDRKILQGSTGERLAEMGRVWKLLGGRRYDLVATLYYDGRYRMLTLPVRAVRRVHLDAEDRGRRLVPGRNHIDELARVLLGLEDTCRDRSLPPVGPERLPGSPLPERGAGRRVALVPGGASNMLRQQTLRRWPVESYVALAAGLLAKGFEVVLVGGPEDAWVRPAFAGMAVLDVVGKLTLPEVVAAFSACDLVVSHDTGPLHLAGISAAKVLALFGPTDPSSFLPRRDGVRGIWGGEGFACRPCYDGQNFAPCRDNGCMRQITVAMVLGEIDVLLGEGARPWRIILPSAIASEETVG